MYHYWLSLAFARHRLELWFHRRPAKIIDFTAWKRMNQVQSLNDFWSSA
ncbi:hypothetical protein MJK72_16585 [Klebsiella pneumoniae]|nr:hypothetical protein MJK72_16585 [Klebsiella pneumoniae]